MRTILHSLLIATLLSAGAAAQDLPNRGPVTNLPLPRFVSMKSAEVNIRRGPSLTHRIDWVFTRRGMPVQVIAEYGHWRRVRDRDGAMGWAHYALLSGVRTAIVTRDLLNLHNKPTEASAVNAQLERNVIARLGACEINWCEVEAGGYDGWAQKSGLWGVAADELRD